MAHKPGPRNRQPPFSQPPPQALSNAALELRTTLIAVGLLLSATAAQAINCFGASAATLADLDYDPQNHPPTCTIG